MAAFLALALSFCGITGSSFGQDAEGEASASAPAIMAIASPWDFSEVVKGQTKEQVFEIENIGSADLVIERIHACCGYDVPYVSTWVIRPHSRARLTITCDSSRKPLGRDNKTIAIASNDPNNPEIKVTVQANITEEPQTAALSVPAISAARLYERRLQGEGIVLLDVREASEFSAKHIPDAINAPKSGFKFSTDEELMNLVRTDKAPAIAVYCGGGFRSHYITRQLVERGYNALNLEGGLAAWAKEGYPVVIGPRPPSSQEPLAIGLEEAYEHYYLLFKDNAFWVDARDPKEYAAGHINGAVNIPADAVEANMELIPKDKEVVLYCADEGCTASRSAAIILIKNGYSQARLKVFEAGYTAWEAAGCPTQTGNGRLEN